jgi:CHAT domain-containing protein
VAADGELTRLPLAVLPLDNGRRLIDLYEISHVATGRDLLRCDVPFLGAAGEPVVIADPDYGSGAGLERLSGTRAEGLRVGELLRVQPWLDGSARKDRLLGVRGPRVLHLATHALFQEAAEPEPDQGRSLLAGTPPDARRENPLLHARLFLADGAVTARDVAGLDLAATELVVLSACEPARDRGKIGVSVAGMQRSFLLAGARSLVLSLWRGSDAQRQEMVEELYRRILGGQAPGAALRDVQLAMKARHAHPLAWGGMICHGLPTT